MKYKGFLLDIDNTLYRYDTTHKIALDVVLMELQTKISISIEDIKEKYDMARKQIHMELKETAASHNRLLYFQRTMELLNINSLNYSKDLYDLYWNVFIENLDIYENVYEFLNLVKEYKICLLTDLTADVQFKKIKKLRLHAYCDFIVTSEEAGVEKPHPYMFMHALKKIKLNPNEVCMIGDSYSKDILGAQNIGIHSYWLNQSEIIEKHSDLVTPFKNFNELMRYIR